MSLLRRLLLIAFAIVYSAAFARAQTSTKPATTQAGGTRFPRQSVHYDLGPDSKRRDGVPKGEVKQFDWTESKIFPGTIRHCAVYVPAQYDSNKPAALMVFQDGTSYWKDNGDFRVPIVFDNLINSHEMPVTIGVFVDPGFKRKEFPKAGESHFTAEDRSFEYDTLSRDYAEFLLTEILPYVHQQFGLNITDDPDGRAICGISSGGICAFTVAWQRPDQFHKVVAHVGSFTNIRDGDKYPEIIRAAEWKPIRVFLQDGANDNRGDARYRRPGWNWVVANHLMAAALEEKDYDYKYVYGEGPHSGNYGGAIFPDTMRWLWRDYQK